MVETYTIPGPYSMATGERLPPETYTRESLGHAPIVRRRTATFPSRMRAYFDCTAWGAGFFPASGVGPGAVVLNHRTGVCMDMQSGRVYRDSRFAQVGDDSTKG